MRMQAMSKLVLCVLFLLLPFALITNVAAADKISSVIQNPGEWANKPVTVAGVVSNSQAVTPNPMDEPPIKGEFDLTDKSGVIHIRTVDNPPANGIKLSVTGTVDASTDPPIIMQTDIGGVFDGNWPLIVALAVLVVMAIVLVVMLARKPQSKRQSISSPKSTPQGIQGPPPVHSIKPSIICPSCGSRNDADAKHCEGCGKQLKGSTVSPPRSSAEPRIEEKGTIPPPSSGPATADLTVTETTGKQLNARFELSKDKKGLKIGRDSKMGIRLDDETVSKEHARVWWSEEDGAFYIQDENSTWGTMVNGQKVSRVALNDNDEIMLGKTKLVFRVIGTQTPGDRTVPPPSA